MNTVTGEQLEIASGGARAIVTEVGAALRLFEIEGVPYTETFGEDQHPPLGCGNVLIPWPNRVAGARWPLDGVEQRLEVTEPERGNAIHGLVRHVTWRVEDRTESAVTFATAVVPQRGWPVELRVTVRYEVTDHGLAVTYRLRNAGFETTPFGVGMHPYFRVGDASTDACDLRLAATTVLPLDPDTMIPSAPAHPIPDALSFASGRSLAGFDLDTPYGGCVAEPDGFVHHRLSTTDSAVEIWADPDFRWVQVFTPAEFPGRGRAVAIEPMTCPPDALNSGVDLLTLGPGQSWRGRWGIVVQR